MSANGPSITRYRVAAIQYEPMPGAKEQNTGDLLRLVEEAAQNEARLIVLPEMATTGYCWESREEIAPHVELIPGPTTDCFQQLAVHYGSYIALSLPEVDPDTNIYYNSVALLGPEGIVGTYRKIHSYISEPRWARDGDIGMPVWETPLGRLTALVCMDAEYFEAARIPALHGADVILFPTNWLDDKSPCSCWMARAFENRVYFIAANRYGLERGVQFSGGSCVLNPDGTIQSYLDNGEGIVYGEVDLNQSRDKNWPVGASFMTPSQPTTPSQNITHLQTPTGNCLADRRPAEYTTLTSNTYLWEPLRYHGLYQLGELPPGQLSCVAIVQTNLEEVRSLPGMEQVQAWRGMLEGLIKDHTPALPDVLVLPELTIPGPVPPRQASDQSFAASIVAHFHHGAIQIPGPETNALVELAKEFQISLVLGVAERDERTRTNGEPVYYNTVLLIDPEGIYGTYRKLHLTTLDRLWASPGNLGLPIFDTPTGRIGLATGYDVLFPETLRVLAGKGADLVCAPALLNFPDPVGLGPTTIPFGRPTAPDEYDPTHFLIWRVRAAEHHVYLALANWCGAWNGIHANGYSGIFSPTREIYPLKEVIADEGELTLTMMTIDTREQRTGRRSSTQPLTYAPGDVLGSLTGELDYDIRDSIPGNVVRSKPLLRKRQPFWYLDLVKTRLSND
ncbi:MAG TPA: nitrilase-related carbon-nitrogen hydrolase [Ktedonobacteraceae bacterium]|nr:nitrilase-related carbon-nitrogen hydrolase [Ktedonobacteraceae bacterium]